MRTPEQRRAEAETLVAQARRTRNPIARGRLLRRVDELLAELRAKGYRELPDGGWINPDGAAVIGDFSNKT